MTILFLHAFLFLIWFDPSLPCHSFSRIYRIVREYPVHSQAAHVRPPQNVLYAMDVACIWYFKQVQCLQRSAATTCLLRKHGFAACLILGAKQMPFRAHAWVELNNQVVNDKPYVHEIYGVLDRC